VKIAINSAADLAAAIRATRKAHRLRLDDLAGAAGVGTVFAGDVEHGKETVQLGRVLRLLHELGIKLHAELPPAASATYESVRARGIKPRSHRASRQSGRGPDAS
jgi:transcriptional regulator with XRE-family HTH domain